MLSCYYSPAVEICDYPSLGCSVSKTKMYQEEEKRDRLIFWDCPIGIPLFCVAGAHSNEKDKGVRRQEEKE